MNEITKDGNKLTADQVILKECIFAFESFQELLGINIEFLWRKNIFTVC